MEIERVKQGIRKARGQLQTLYEKAAAEAGEDGAAIFTVHQMLLEDEEYLGAVTDLIRTKQVSAQYAAAMAGDQFSAIFAGMEDDYMKARAEDIRDVSNRLARCLSGEGEEDFRFKEPAIIIADDLAPSETVRRYRWTKKKFWHW